MADTNYAVAPGEYLEEWIDTQGFTQRRVAEMLGFSRKHVNEIVNGRAPITGDTALRLERVVGIPASAWLRYETLYRADLARIADEEDLSSHINEIHPSAASYLRSIGATQETRRNPGRLVSDFLAFHRCGTWEAYLHVQESMFSSALASAPPEGASSHVDLTALTSWLRAGELTESFEFGRRIVFNKDRLRAALPQLRERALAPDSSREGDLAEMLAGVGVAYVLLEPPAGLQLHGVSHWIDGNIPVVQQIPPRGGEGLIPWNLFHQLGHILNDPRREMHLEYTTPRRRMSPPEQAADAFAAKVLSDEIVVLAGSSLPRE